MIAIFGIKLSSILAGCGFFVAYLVVVAMIAQVIGFSSDKGDE